jgi:YVTN family beta-propeller protein
MTRRALIAAAVLTLASTAFLLADANHPTGTRGILLIDKVGGQIRFIDPVTYKERAAFKVATNPHDFALTADRKTAYVPLYGDGIYGRNPNPGHEVVIVDMEAQKIAGTIDVAPYRAPHGIQVDAQGMIAVPGGTQGIAVSPDGKRVVIMASAEPTALVIDPATDTIVDRITLANQKGGGYKAYYSPDGKYLLTMNLGSASINIFDAANLRGMQHTLTVGKDPMGFAFSADGKTVLVANHGDGSVSVVDLATKKETNRFQAGTGIETLTYY